MKKFTKTLSIVLLVAMCMSMFTVGAFAADHASTDTVTKYDAKAATCTENGQKEHYRCSCGRWYWDAECTRYIGDANAVVVASTGHNPQKIDAKAATCKAAGNTEHYVCACGQYFAADGVTAIQASDVVLNTVNHVAGTKVEAVAATCTETGSKEYYLCSYGCGTKVDASGNVIADITVAVLGHDHNSNGICVRCGDRLNAPEPFAVSGSASVDYKNAASFKYNVTDPATYILESISAGGYNLVRGAGFSYDSYTGTITIDKNALSGIVSGKSSVELVFTATDGSQVGGFYITNSDNYNVDDLVINGLSQNKYLKGSNANVSFQTNDPDPSNIKVFFGNSQLDVPVWAFTFEAAYNDKYTFKFANDYLDSLTCGTYQIRAYYGTGSYADYKTPGTLTISDADVNWDDTLYYTNGTQGNSSVYKYVSGDAVPRIYCGLFLSGHAKLQVSTNGGVSWSDVNVHNYYIEQSNGNCTAYAWLKDTYLDSMDAGKTTYFRVVIPASASTGVATQINSNYIELYTGPTLKAVDTSKHVINSTKNLRFVASEKISKVYVGNIQLTDSNDFSISNDGKTVTLSPEFLNKRTAGNTYTIKVLTASGEYASTTFQILTTAQASASPRTGDDSNIALWTAFLMLSGAAVVAVLPRLKKEK